MKYIVDTHALVWFLEGNSLLGTGAKTVLTDSASQLILPAIALAEAVWVVDRARTSIPSVTDLLKAINADSRIIIYPIDKAVIEQSISLSAITEMHDRLIVATALVLENRGEKIGLLTCDRDITASGLISLIWKKSYPGNRRDRVAEAKPHREAYPKGNGLYHFDGWSGCN